MRDTTITKDTTAEAWASQDALVDAAFFLEHITRSLSMLRQYSQATYQLQDAEQYALNTLCAKRFEFIYKGASALVCAMASILGKHGKLRDIEITMHDGQVIVLPLGA